MTPAQQNLLEKAEQSLNAAKVLQKNNFPDYAASRAYYAMFYTIEALLLEKKLSFSSHSAVISAFGREFVKAGTIPQAFHRILINAQDLRNTGDYGELDAVTPEQSQEQIDNAEKLLRLIENIV